MIEPRQPGQAFLAQQRQMDGEGQGAEAGIGADIAGGLFAADMLLAGGKRQHIAAPAFQHPPSRRSGGPASGAGIFRGWRTGRHRVRRNSGHCRCVWPSAATMSAPCAPGDSRRPSDTTSVTTAISSAPLAWAASAMGRRLRIRPKTSGLCTTTQAVPSSIRAIMSSALPGVTGARRHRPDRPATVSTVSA